MDREKVIKEAEEFIKHLAPDDKHKRHIGIMVNLGWIYDALALLKEQEAVVPYQFEDIWKCGNCGDGVVAYEELGVSGIEEVRFDYCPTCGRPVLWEGR